MVVQRAKLYETFCIVFIIYTSSNFYLKVEGYSMRSSGILMHITSLPGKYGVVTRPYVVRVRAQDRNGAFFEVEDEALTARCFCHEIEHLDGHLFIEHTDHLLSEEELEAYIREQEAEEEDEEE